MKSAFVYVRVSSPGQADHGESLEVQEALCRAFAERNGYRVEEVFREPYSGRKHDRPILNRLFERIEKSSSQVDAVIIRCIDRFTRGGASPYQDLKQRLHEHRIDLVDTAGTIQPKCNALEHLGFEYEWSVESPSRTSEAIAAETAHQEVRKILIRTVEEQIRLVQQGYRTRPAPIGFQNQKIEDAEGKKKTILVPDETEAPWIQAIYRLRAEGQLNDLEICERVNAMGFRSRKRRRREPLTRKVLGTVGGKPLTRKLLQRIVRRTANCGVLMEKWTHGKPIRAPYSGLVTIEEFNRANRGKIEILELQDGSLAVQNGAEKQVRQLYNPSYPYRFVVRCPECGRPFKGSASRGRLGKIYPGYHCNRDHDYLRIPLPNFHDAVESFAERIELRSECLQLMEAVAHDVWEKKRAESADTAAQVQQNQQSLESRQQLLLEQFTQAESPVVRRLLEKQIEELDQEISTSKEHGGEVGPTKQTIKEYLSRVRQVVEHPKLLLLDRGNQQILQQMWGFVFDAFPTYQELHGGTPKMALAFTLCEESERSEGQMVALLSSKWNHFVKQVEEGCRLPEENFRH